MSSTSSHILGPFVKRAGLFFWYSSKGVGSLGPKGEPPYIQKDNPLMWKMSPNAREESPHIREEVANPRFEP